MPTMYIYLEKFRNDYIEQYAKDNKINKQDVVMACIDRCMATDAEEEPEEPKQEITNNPDIGLGEFDNASA